jgi:hypothetical protein
LLATRQKTNCQRQNKGEENEKKRMVGYDFGNDITYHVLHSFMCKKGGAIRAGTDDSTGSLKGT